jgi:hypothetical protein
MDQPLLARALILNKIEAVNAVDHDERVLICSPTQGIGLP